MPVVFLLLFVYVFGGTLGAGLAGVAGGRAEYVDYVTPGHPAARRRRRRPGHGDLGRHGHDRGHHRPLPHDGDRPRLGAHRPRRRQPDPDDAQRWRSSSRVALRDRASGPTAGAARLARARSACSRWSRFALTWLSVALGMVSQERRDREQPADAAAPAAVPRQRRSSPPTRCRPACAGSPSTSRSRPIIETLRGPADGHRRSATAAIARRRLVRRHRARRLPVGASDLFNRDPTP